MIDRSLPRTSFSTGYRLRAMHKTLVLLLSVLISPLAGADQQPSGPNVLYIIADDQSYRDFGFMGNRSVHTPNLDDLAAQSAVFPNGYVPSSVCRPSLMTLLTGLYPHQHSITFNHGPPGNRGYNQMTSREAYERIRGREFTAVQHLPTLPRLLVQQAGFAALQTGKHWEGHWRLAGFTDGMTRFIAPPETQAYGGIRRLANGEAVAHGNGDWGLQIGRETMQPIFDFISAATQRKQPWFAWYAPFLPHQPHDSPERFRRLAAQRPDVQPHQLPYYAAIAQFDETVGQLLSFLRQENLMRQTLIVFVSDNGWVASETVEPSRPVEFAQTKNSKRSPFEDGIRTPILLSWHGMIPARIHPALVQTVDLMPTILAATGVTKKAGQSESSTKFPGTNLLPLVRDEASADPERIIFGEIYPGDATSLEEPTTDLAYLWARQNDFKLIIPIIKAGKQHAWGSYLASQEAALFNLKQDPEEQTNVAKQHPQIAARLHEAINAWWSPK